MKAIRFGIMRFVIPMAMAALLPGIAPGIVIETFDVAPDPAEWTLSGNAAWDSEYQALFITDAVDSQTGSIFWHEQFSGERFNISFDLWIGGGDGADGMTFAWLRGPSLLGGGGGSMGFDGLDGYGVRFDTYSGGAPEPENYIAISSVTPSVRTDLATNDTIPKMEDVITSEGLPAPFHVEIKFDNGHVEMWMSNETAAAPMPLTQVFDYTIAGYTAFDAWLGFTAATGGANNVHAVDNITINKGAYAGEDIVAFAGDPVTLDGSGSFDASSYTWSQTAGEPTVTLDNPTPADGISHFTAPTLDIGTVLTFQLDIESPSGPSSDTVKVTIKAKNAPKLAPPNLQTVRRHLGLGMLWDPVIDADEYVVEIEVSAGVWFPLATVTVPEHNIGNLESGKAYRIRVKCRNSYGDGPTTDPFLYVAMGNLALPAPKGTKPPLAHVQGQTYVISHYDLPDMNNEAYDDTNDSWDGNLKSEDFWGYLWGSALYFQHVVYYQGEIFGNGGWWRSLKVQYTQDGTTWQDVRGLTIVPAYDFTNTAAAHTAYARYDLTFVRVNGVGVRIYGTPGGTATFTSISELEVYGDQDPNAAVADPGPDREVQEGDPVTLDGSGSPNAVSYSWTQVSGPSVTLTNPDSAQASFTAPSGPPIIAGNTDFVFLLTVTDAQSKTSSCPVTITVIDADAVSVSTAGTDTTVNEGTEAHLVGSSSINAVNFKWTQVAGPTAIIADDTQADITFRAPPVYGPTKLTFELYVDNGPGLHSETATVAITVLDRDGAIDTEKFTLQLDMTSIVDRDGVCSVAVGAQPGDGYDAGGNCLIEDGFNGQPGLPSDGKVLDFQLRDYDVLNMLSVFPGEGDTSFDLAATGQGGYYEKLRFLSSTGSGYYGSQMDRLVVQLVYDDSSTQEFLLLSQDWYLGSPPRTPPEPLTIGISGMSRESGEPSPNFALFVFEFDQVEGKKLSKMIFMESHDLSTIGDPSASNVLNLMAITGEGYRPPTVGTARVLPMGYEPGGNVDVQIYVYPDPGETPPASLTVTERFPAELTVVNNGGGTPGPGSITWTFSGAQVQPRVISYTLGIPGDQSGAVAFPGTLSYASVTNQPIGGDQELYVRPSAPRNLDVQMLLSADLSWTDPPEGGIVGYHVFRSVNGGPWDDISGLITTRTFRDMDIAPGDYYRYKVSAVNVGGAEGPASSPSDPATITMEIVEAEHFDYGGGQHPWSPGVTVAAVEATAANDLEGTDFYHPDKGGGTATRTYRPLDNLAIETAEEADKPGVYHTNIAAIATGSWWRYTLDVEEAGWIKLVFRVASPRAEAAVAAYWDEQLVGIARTAGTGSWRRFTYAVLEEQVQTTTGPHTLRVEAVETDTFFANDLNFDKIGIGFNWSPPKRQVIFEDDFEDYTTLYVPDDPVAAGWSVENGSGYPNARWRLWNTDPDTTDWLGNESPDIAGMTNNYMITDSDLAPDAAMDEGLLTPELDCTNWIKLRLDFNKNFRIYPDDTTHLQVGEVDILVYNEETSSWGEWINLLHFDRNNVADINSAPEAVDLSAYDENRIRIRWHFHQAQYDYWFAVDDVVISGEMKEIPVGQISEVRVFEGKVELTWDPFGGGNYTVEYTDDLASGNWQPVPDVTWPITETTWAGEEIAAMGKRFYRVASQ